MPDFSVRSNEPELMDDVAIGGPELRATLAELAFINRHLGGYAPSLSGVSTLIREAQKIDPNRREFSLLDVGTGSADTPRRLAQWAATHGIRLRILGIDLSATTVDYARELCAEFPDITIAQKNVFDFDAVPAFDIVHAALVLHHFPGDEAAHGLRQMAALARLGVVVNDLHRHGFAYRAIRLLTRLFSRNRLIRHDAPRSVERAFSRPEWDAMATHAALSPPEVRWMWAFRWRVIIRRPSHAPLAPTSDT